MTGTRGSETDDPRSSSSLERENQLLKEQLYQSQKLEAIGRLAGGIAHDFNNLLTAITGYSDLMLEHLSTESTLRRDLLQIRGLADRAAGLTRQLLAFGRRQTLQPKIINLNEVVENVQGVLARLIGEDVQIRFVPDSTLGSVKADPGQLEQVLMNLVVNARDAMPDGGSVTIETANVTLDKDYAVRHFDAKTGPYVMLAVTDTGCGMDEATRQRIFEPFFTTKEPGRGTGLGLSMVYGIAKQHDGHIWVYSEIGKGTTFKIYLPRVDAEAQELQMQRANEPVPRGSETILVVEDEDTVRNLVQQVLEGQGYTVFSAGDPDEAEKILAANGRKFALLLTDLVMPGRSGRELYQRIASTRPGVKVLYMSGYTDTNLRQGMLELNAPFVQKPFAPSELARKVRQVLDSAVSQ